MKLSELPAEVLGQILSTPTHSFLVIPLLHCGNALLSRKLVLAVNLVDLKRAKGVSMRLLPKCVSSFTNLRSLSYTAQHQLSMPDLSNLYKELLTLPTTKLEKLKIEITQFKLSDFLEAKRILASTNHEIASTPTILPFSHLISLQIPISSRWDANHLALLPPTLTDLATRSFRFNAKTYKEPVFANLPRGLLVWTTVIEFDNNISTVHLEDFLFWQNPPSCLHTLGALDLSGCQYLDHIALLLPRSLTSCEGICSVATVHAYTIVSPSCWFEEYRYRNYIFKRCYFIWRKMELDLGRSS